MANCPECDNTDNFLHLHNCAHGIPETHMGGTERYECKKCGHVMYKEEGEKQGFTFILDK